MNYIGLTVMIVICGLFSGLLAWWQPSFFGGVALAVGATSVEIGVVMGLVAGLVGGIFSSLSSGCIRI